MEARSVVINNFLWLEKQSNEEIPLGDEIQSDNSSEHSEHDTELDDDEAVL